MNELSLNILDIAENSVRAGASLIKIGIEANLSENLLRIVVEDNGCGMTSEELSRVTDPFYTTRTNRKVGLGIPFFKAATECAGGSFNIASKFGKGTLIIGEFQLNNIDRAPLGDVCSTVHVLITMHNEINFSFSYKVDEKEFRVHTEEFRKILGDVNFNTLEVSRYIMEYLKENVLFVNGEKII